MTYDRDDLAALAGPDPTYPPGWIDDPMAGLANWYAPDGVTHISTREANELLADPRRHIACTAVGPYQVCTRFLVLDHSLNLTALGFPEVRLLWETAAWANTTAAEEDRDELLGIAERRYASLVSARAGHVEVVAAVAARFAVSDDQVVDDVTAGDSPVARGERDWRTP